MLPLNVCFVCVKALRICDDLYKKCQRTDILLRQEINLGNKPFLSGVIANQHQQVAAVPALIKPSSPSKNSVICAQSKLKKACNKKDARNANSRAKVASPLFPNNEGKDVTEEIDTFDMGADKSIIPEVLNVMESSENEFDESDEEKLGSLEVICDICQHVCDSVDELKSHRNTHTPEELLKCTDCGKIMPNEVSLRTHKNTHINNIHPCEICGKILASKRGLVVHKETHDEGRAKFYCEICGKSAFTMPKLRDHMASHSDERHFDCVTCGQKFKTKGTLKQHALIHKEVPTCICDLCGCAFNRPSHLRHHIKNRHEKENSKGSVKYSRSSKRSRGLTSDGHCSKTYECKICNVECEKLCSLLEHFTESHSDKLGNLLCCNCGKQYKEEQKFKDHQKNCGAKWKCNFCGKVYFTTSSMGLHRRTHTGEEQPYTCKYCGKACRTKFLVREHERVHTGEKPYECTVCSKTFSCYTNLYQHKLVHKGEKKHKCKLCSYETVRLAALKHHQIFHSDAKPYSCKVCGRSFKYSWNCKKHSEQHNLDSLEAVVTCLTKS